MLFKSIRTTFTGRFIQLTAVRLADNTGEKIRRSCRCDRVRLSEVRQLTQEQAVVIVKLPRA